MNTEEILYICTSCGIKENIPKEQDDFYQEVCRLSDTAGLQHRHTRK